MLIGDKNNNISCIESTAREYFEGSSGCHDWSHVERVRRLALRIGEAEGADLFVLEAACLLHDIGRKEEMDSGGSFCHAERGAELADGILRKHRVGDHDIERIKHCIICHRYRNGHVPQSVEAKVLYDADKLDSIGAVGIARDFIFAGFFGNSLYTGNEKKLIESGVDASYTSDDTAIMEYEIKLKKIKDKMLTETGKSMARERHDFMVNFFERFWEEVDGRQ